jgi:hypothetical protein
VGVGKPGSATYIAPFSITIYRLLPLPPLCPAEPHHDALPRPQVQPASVRLTPTSCIPRPSTPDLQPRQTIAEASGRLLRNVQDRIGYYVIYASEETSFNQITNKFQRFLTIVCTIRTQWSAWTLSLVRYTKNVCVALFVTLCAVLLEHDVLVCAICVFLCFFYNIQIYFAICSNTFSRMES